MKYFLVLVALVGLLSIPMVAQDYPKAEVFGGYQFLHTGTIHVAGQDIPDSSENWNGWDAGATGYFNKYFGVQGDFSGSYKTINHVSGHVYTYAGGPVIAYREGKVNPFVHALFGGSHFTASASGAGSGSNNGFTMMYGGGADIKMSKILALRGQVDWVYFHVSGISLTNNVRVATGIVLRF